MFNKSTREGADIRAPQSTRELLESTRLTKLPSLARRKPLNLDGVQCPKAAACVGCGGRLDGDDNFQQSIKVCRKCLAHYAKIESAIDEASKRKRRELIAKFAGGENE